MGGGEGGKGMLAGDWHRTGTCCARAVGTHYCLAVGNDEGLELDETDEDEELCESNEEEVEEYKG